MLQLTAAQVRGTMSVLRPEAFCLSPALGLLMFDNPVLVTNLMQCQVRYGRGGLGLQAASGLASELFFQRYRGDPISATRSRSCAAHYMTPSMLGHMVGIALRRDVPTDCELDTQLGHLGVTCNHVDGKRTKVSLARFRKIIRLIAEDTRVPDGSLTLLLALRLLWEKAESKRCLLNFMLAVDSHHPLIADQHAALRNDPGRQAEWLELRFSSHELEDRDATDDSACSLLGLQAEDSHGVAVAVERLAAALSLARSAKRPVDVRHYSFCDGRKRPDCVEVVLRETVDLLLLDSVANQFVAERLPCAAAPALRKFYCAQGTDINSFQDSEQIGSAWFNLCSELPGCDYLSVAPGGQKYELEPSLLNVSRALGILLGLGDCSRMEDVAAAWNDHAASRACPRLAVTTEVQSVIRQEERVFKEVAYLRLLEKGRADSAAPSIEVRLEKAHRLATVSHSAARDRYISHMTVDIQLKYWQELCIGQVQPAPHVRAVLVSLWPSLLGSKMLAAMTDIVKQSVAAELLLALLSTAWGPEREKALRDHSATTTDGAVTNARERADKVAAIESIANAVSAVSHLCARGQVEPAVASSLVGWLLREGPPTEGVAAAQLARNLCTLPAPVLRSEEVAEAVGQCRPEAALLAKLIRNGTGLDVGWRAKVDEADCSTLAHRILPKMPRSTDIIAWLCFLVGRWILLRST